MDPTQGRQAATAIPLLYSDLIEIIMSYLVSELPEKPHTKTLSRCALVCREWCRISRKITFAHIQYLQIHELAEVRELLVPTSEANGSSLLPTPLNTFAKHVRSAGVKLQLDDSGEYDQWDDAKDLIMLIRASFPLNYQLKLRITYDRMYSRHFFDILSIGGAQNLVDLWLRQIALAVDPKELAHLLCDESLPSLRRLTLWRTTWDPDKSGVKGSGGEGPVDRLFVQHDDTYDGSRKLSLTLDVLCFFVIGSRPGGRMFFPHELFSELCVITLVVNHTGADALDLFWKEAPTMLRALSPSLVVLDLSYPHLPYEGVQQSIPGIELTRLRILKLKIEGSYVVPGGVYSTLPAFATPGRERQVAEILESIIAPQLQTIDFYIFLPDPAVPLQQPMRVKGWIHSQMRWDIIDPALESLRLKGLSRVYFNVSDRDWEHSNISKDRAFELLREHLPRCVSKGLIISYSILENFP